MSHPHRHALLPSLLLFLLASLSSLDAQVYECIGTDGWLPAGAGQNGDSVTGFAAATDDDLLYLFSGGYDARGLLSVWDGSTVRTLSTTGLDNFDFPTMEVYKGMVYLGGQFAAVGGVPGTTGLARWNGTRWETTGAAAEAVIAMIVYRDRLYVADARGIVAADGGALGTFAVYDGSAWSRAAALGGNSFITAMAIHDGSLIISGEFTSVDGTSATNFARFDGTAWNAIPALDGAQPTGDMIQYHNGLYFVDSYEWIIMEWDGGSGVKAISDPLQIPVMTGWPSEHSLAVHNDMLYTVGYVEVAATPQPLRRTCAAYDGSDWHAVSSMRAYPALIEYRGTLMAHGVIRASCGTSLHNLAFYCDNNNCSRITGSIYSDADGNCRRDSTDQGIPGRIVEVLPGPIYTTTNASGDYAQFVRPGSYTVSAAPYLHWSIDCPAAIPIGVTIGAAGQTRSGNDFAVAPIPGIRDLRVSIAGEAIRAGRATRYFLHYVNVGTAPASGTIRFTYDNTVLLFTGSSLAPERQSAGMAEWEIAPVEPGEEGTIVVTMTAATTTPVGTMVCVSADMALPDAVIEEIPLDNHDEVCTTVSAAFDPNDITVAPSDYDFDYLHPDDTVLTYQIRFQNTGNDTAFRIVLRDTLDPSLDIPTIAMGASSHPYTWRLEGGNVLVITFEEILLPDSRASEPNSHGVVRYRVHLRHGLAPRTEIRNRVGIYFDYNRVVMTNEVISRTSAISTVAADRAEPLVRSYPLPARDILYIDGRLVTGSAITLRRVDGTTARSAPATGSAHEQLSVAGLASGVYLLDLETPAGARSERVIIAR